jgi:hypothetical protein
MVEPPLEAKPRHRRAPVWCEPAMLEPKILRRIIVGLIDGHGSSTGLALPLEGYSDSGAHAGGKRPALNEHSPIAVSRSGRRDDGEPVQKLLQKLNITTLFSSHEQSGS